MRHALMASVLVLALAAQVHSARADVRLFVRHEVTDYAAWRKVYNSFAATQKKLGVTAQAVYQSVDDPNDVTVTHDFKTAEQAKAFTASPELKEAMGKSGVKGAPTIWYTKKAAK